MYLYIFFCTARYIQCPAAYHIRDLIPAIAGIFKPPALAIFSTPYCLCYAGQGSARTVLGIQYFFAVDIGDAVYAIGNGCELYFLTGFRGVFLLQHLSIPGPVPVFTGVGMGITTIVLVAFYMKGCTLHVRAGSSHSLVTACCINGTAAANIAHQGSRRK